MTEQLAANYDEQISGLEPSVRGNQSTWLSGMEPELGGTRRFRPDPQLMKMLLGSDEGERFAAIDQILDRGQGRLYALEVVKMIPPHRVGKGRNRRYAYSPAERIAAARALDHSPEHGVKRLVRKASRRSGTPQTPLVAR